MQYYHNMKTLLTDLIAYLVAQDIGTAGTDLFLTGFAGDADNQVAIIGTGGVEPYKDIPVARPTVQILVRNTDRQTGLDKAYDIFYLLDKKDDKLVLKTGGVDIMQINALGEPAYLGRDNADRHIYSMNFVFMCRINE